MFGARTLIRLTNWNLVLNLGIETILEVKLRWGRSTDIDNNSDTGILNVGGNASTVSWPAGGFDYLAHVLTNKIRDQLCKIQDTLM